MTKHKTNTRGVVSHQTLFVALCAVALIAFFAGTRSDDLLRVVGPAVGLNSATEELDLSSVQQTYQALAHSYAGKLDVQKLIYGANKGLVAAAGDPYTVFLDPNDASELDKDLSGDIGGGIGAEIGIRNDKPTILRLLDGNPAASSGLAVGDVITKVNDQSTKGWDAAKTAQAIRGEEGTSVRLTVKRAGETKVFSVTRKIVNNPSVYGDIQNSVGIMTITRFDQDTSRLAEAQAIRFKEAGVKGVVVDVRNDGGGYLDAATGVASLWLDDKTVVTQKAKGKTVSVETADKGRAILSSMPTVVLVNGGTASASEILAGALRDYDKATIVGEKTFGKGSVQEIITFGSGAELKVTVAKWFTPKGSNVAEAGLTPDVKVGLNKKQVNNGDDPQLDAAVQRLR